MKRLWCWLRGHHDSESRYHFAKGASIGKLTLTCRCCGQSWTRRAGRSEIPERDRA